MKYVAYLNELIKKRLAQAEPVVMYGQNIAGGSCLSGLCKGIKMNNPDSKIINATNSENTLTGIGFGMMMNAVPAIFFMKQLDFLALGIDHLINTYNFIRRKPVTNPRQSFTIFATVVDAGFEGLQSSHNNFADFCSIARVPGFTITNSYDAKKIIEKHLIAPGFRIIGIGQRLYAGEMLEFSSVVTEAEDATWFQYTKGESATIVCFNFSFPYGYELYQKFKENGTETSLFSVNALTPINWDGIIADVKKTKKLIVIDDSKSENVSCYQFLNDVADSGTILTKKKIIKRDMSGDWLKPQHHKLEINYEEVINDFM